jgi:hypothetical protein
MRMPWILLFAGSSLFCSFACNRDMGDSCRIFNCSPPLVCEQTGDYQRLCTVHCEQVACPRAAVCVASPVGAICIPSNMSEGWERVR